MNLIGQIWGCIGIPNHSRDLFREIIKQCPGSTIFPLVQGPKDPYDIDPDFESHIKFGKIESKLAGPTFIFWTPDIYKQVLPMLDRGKTILVGYVIWEWTKLSQEWLDGIALLDYVACPSQWHKQILLDHGVDESRIIILEAGVNPVYLKDYDVDRRHKYIFVGKYEKRKCIEELISSFMRVVPQEQATLTLLCTDPHDPHFDVVKALHLEGHTNIDISARPRTPEEMAKLYSAHQYILVPSRSGGIELPLIEGMACGCYPLVSKCSGMEHYVPASHHGFIPVKDMIPMYDTRWFPPTTDWGTWAEPDWEVFDKLLGNTMAGPININDSNDLKIRARTLYNYPEIVKNFLLWITLASKNKCGGGCK